MPDLYTRAMGVRNRRPDLNGVLVIDKPMGITSAGVVRRVRWLTSGAKVGHAGTLDPMATGVLVLCLGTATREIDRFMTGGKRYTAEVCLAAFSTTDDAEGELTRVDVREPPPRERIDGLLAARFTGEVMQTPPDFSAVKVGGERAYRVARAGGAPAVKPRPVRIHAIDVVEYAWPKLVVDVRCGKGTYIRSIARDLGRELGTGGMLTALRRTASEPFSEGDAMGLGDLTAELIESRLRDPASIV